MPGERTLIYWDTCLFLAYLNAEPGRIDTLEVIVNQVLASKGDMKIVTSTLTKVEAYHLGPEIRGMTLDPQAEEKMDFVWDDESIVSLVEVHDDIALAARSLLRRAMSICKLKAPDAIHLATAQWLGVREFQTYDKALMDCGVLVDFPICEPSVAQPRLPNSMP